MIIDYKIVRAKDLPAEFARIIYDPDDFVSVVARYEDDELAEVIGWDGGEPEDQTLTRDWSWIVMALKNAYELGWNKSRRAIGV